LSTVVSEFGALSDVAGRTNNAYTCQLSLAVGLHFSSVLVDVYLFCFHIVSLSVPWTIDSVGGARTVNDLCRLSAISGAAHYAFKQVCTCACVSRKEILEEKLSVIHFSVFQDNELKSIIFNYDLLNILINDVGFY
jgi:hypothetical protein